jgi:superoxide dismutase, Fe-Mn family
MAIGDIVGTKRSPTPLPFDPKGLRGFSERLIVSHHENNYAGALSNLNRVQEEITRVTKDTPPFIMAGLKERELTFANSVILHEHYFANLGGDGHLDGAIEKALSHAYGSVGRWEELLRLAGLSLAGGSGWAILDLDLKEQNLRIYWSGNHTQSLALGRPLLVLDMYEHSYHLDYGARQRGTSMRSSRTSTGTKLTTALNERRRQPRLCGPKSLMSSPDSAPEPSLMNAVYALVSLVVYAIAAGQMRRS